MNICHRSRTSSLFRAIGSFLSVLTMFMWSSLAMAQTGLEPIDGGTFEGGESIPSDTQIGSGPDLSATITKVTVRIRPTGHKLVVKLEICNDGDDVAGPFPVSLFLSTDATWDDNDDLLQSFMIDALGPSACIQSTKADYRFKVPKLDSLDALFAIVVLDPNSDVANELVTTNNVLVESLQGPFVSSGTRVPGQFVTLAHPSIQADSVVTVTFSGPNAYVVSAMTDLTTAGQAKIPVPVMMDLATSEFTRGTVSVSIDGLAGQASLKIRDLPEVDAEPGEITREFLLFAMDNYASVTSKLTRLSDETGFGVADAVAAIDTQVASLQAMDAELASRQVALEIDGETVVMDAVQLRLLDRFVAATVLGVAEETEESLVVSSSGVLNKRQTRSSPLTLQGLADRLKKIKSTGLAGAQALGSGISVTAGTVGLAASFVPGGQGVAAGAAILTVTSTSAITGMAATGSFVADVAIDALEGRIPNVYRAGQNALVVVGNGVKSIVITAAGAASWAGSTIVSIFGLAEDTRAVVQGVRDLQCASQSELKGLTFVPDSPVSLGEFCSLTDATGTQSSPIDSTPLNPDDGLPENTSDVGTFSASITIPGFSLTFAPSLVVGENDGMFSGTITVSNIPTVSAAENITDPFNSAIMALMFDPREIVETGTFRFSDQAFEERVGEATLFYTTPQIADPDGTHVVFDAISGTVTLTAFDSNSGGRLAGTFNATVEGTQDIGTEDDPMERTLTGTITGSFDVPVF